jgi:hypothetical protein
MNKAQADQLQRRLLQEQHQFSGTAEAEQLAGASARADHLADYFGGLATMRNPNNPQEAKDIGTRLKQLAKQHADFLSAAQQAVVPAALATLKTQVAEQEAKAMAWLKERQERVASGVNAQGLARELESPPAFLPEASRPTLDALREALRSQQDAAAQEKAALAQVNALAETGTVSALQDRLAQLAAWATLTPAIVAAATTKRERLQTEVDRLLALPAQWEAKAGAVLTAGEASQLHSSIVRQEAAFVGTEWEDRIQQLAARAKALEEVLRQAESLRSQRDHRLRELDARRKAQEELLSNTFLSEVQRSRLQQDVQDTIQKHTEQIAQLEGDLNRYALALDQATTARALNAVELARLPRSGLPADLLSRLQHLDIRQRELEPVLIQMHGVATTLPRDAAHASSLLDQLTRLTELDLLSAVQREHAHTLQQRVQANLTAKYQEADAWLANKRQRFDALSLEDAEGLAGVQEALRSPHAFLSGDGKKGLSSLQADLKRRLEESEVLQIEVLFSRIKSPELRQACLERLNKLGSLTPA